VVLKASIYLFNDALWNFSL